uniref:MADS-box domain-containing protein n=1 Tax=Oryza meridionalis TaxID=40149 RepID=A0A0E0DDF0_9ORYZ
MGRRGRVVLRRIEDRVRRGICFRKRLAGLEKKAEELAMLCDAHVGFVVLSCSGDGRLHHFAAPAKSSISHPSRLPSSLFPATRGCHRFNHRLTAGVLRQRGLFHHRPPGCSWATGLEYVGLGGDRHSRTTFLGGAPPSGGAAPSSVGTRELQRIRSIENIVERYENSLTAQKGVHGRRILEKTKGKDFHVPKETTDKGPGKDFHVPKETTDKGSNDDDMRSIDETDISTLNMDQLSQIERLLEDELRWTRERKVAGGSQQSAEEMEVVLRHRLSLGTGDRDDSGGDRAAEQLHRTPLPAVDLNVPCRDAGQLQ